jgi:uncharacterized protein
MKVDITDITRVNGASTRVEFEEAAPVGEPVAGYVLNTPVSFEGTLTNVNGILELDGRLKVGYRTECYRCLKAVEGQLDIRVRESFVNGKQDAEEIDAYAFEGKLLDMGKAIEDNIVLNLPMKQVCAEDCRGLCRSCGADLNETTCGCGEDPINPQMEVLSKFFNN